MTGVSLAKNGKSLLPGAQASLPATSLPQRRDELEIQAAQVCNRRRSDVCCRQDACAPGTRCRTRISGELGQKWKVESISYFGICWNAALRYPHRSRAVWLACFWRSLIIKHFVYMLNRSDLSFIAVAFRQRTWADNRASGFSPTSASIGLKPKI